MALAARGNLNSTYCLAVSLTAFRPDASPGRVYADRSGPMTTPVVAALSASCSTKLTLAPRPATKDGSRAARVTGALTLLPASAVPGPPTTKTPKPRAAVANAALKLRDIERLDYVG